MTKKQKEVAKKLFVLACIKHIAQSQIECGGSGGGGTSWKKC